MDPTTIEQPSPRDRPRAKNRTALDHATGLIVRVCRVWLTGHLMPDFKTIADFRKDNGEAIRKVCRAFVLLCRRLDLLGDASVAIDGSKFKAVNNRDKNFTEAKMKRRLEQIDESIARYLSQLDTADRQGPTVPEAKTTRLKEKIAKLREIERLNALNARMMASEDKQISLTDPDARSMATSGKGSGMVGYNVQSAVDTKHHLISAVRFNEGEFST
jgi:hypothetical protein